MKRALLIKKSIAPEDILVKLNDIHPSLNGISSTTESKDIAGPPEGVAISLAVVSIRPSSRSLMPSE